MNRFYIAILVGMMTLTAFTGCQCLPPIFGPIFGTTETVVEPPPSPRLSSIQRFPNCDWARLRRVLVVPVTSPSVSTVDQNEAATRVASSIRGIQCNGSVPLDVVVIDPQDCGPSTARGIYDERQMATLARRYQADAILYCSLVEFSPYQPMSAELSVAMVDSNESVLLLKAHSRVDLLEPAVQDDYGYYTSESEVDRFVIEGRLAAPSNFLSYTVDRTMIPLASKDPAAQ